MLQTRYSRSKWLQIPCRGNSFGGGQCVRGATVNLKENAGKLKKTGHRAPTMSWSWVRPQWFISSPYYQLSPLPSIAIVRVPCNLKLSAAVSAVVPRPFWGSPTATFFDENSSRKSWSGNLRAMCCHGYWRKTGGGDAWPFDIFLIPCCQWGVQVDFWLFLLHELAWGLHRQPSHAACVLFSRMLVAS